MLKLSLHCKQSLDDTDRAATQTFTAWLQELRIACHLAEEEVEGGVSQRVSPLAQVFLPLYKVLKSARKVLNLLSICLHKAEAS